MAADHFQPWTPRQGQASFVWNVLTAVGERTRGDLGPGVTCPSFRFHPAIVAQAAATQEAMYPGRSWLGLGTGEALNEHIVPGYWPEAGERSLRMWEAIELINKLFTASLAGKGRLSVDGNDVEAVYRAALDAAERCRAGRGPIVVEAETYRWHGHYEGDAQPYKPEDESTSWRERDPLVRAGRLLVERGEAEEALERVQAEARARVDAAVERARAADGPALEEAYEHVFAG